MQGRRIKVLISICAAAMGASPGFAGAQVVLHDGWQTGTAAAIPAGWSQQTIQVPGLGPRLVDAIVNDQFSITLDIVPDGAEAGATLANDHPSAVSRAVRRVTRFPPFVLHISFDPPANALKRAQEIAADSFRAHVVPLGDGVWGIADDTEPGAPIVKVVRQTSHGIATATATRLASQLGTGAPDWAPVDTALRQLAGSIDGFLGPDPALLDTSGNTAGLAALAAAWRASRGATRFTITRVVTPPGRVPPFKQVLFHDQAHRIHGAAFALRPPLGIPVGAPLAPGSRFRVRDVFRGGRFFSWEPVRQPGGCFFRSTRRFPAHMRFVKLFADDLLRESEEPGDIQSWPDGFGTFFLPPALILNPERVAQSYNIVFKPVELIGGKTRIQYLWTQHTGRMHIVVRVAGGRIEAIRTERLDQTGNVVAFQSIRIAYTVSPALAAAPRPVCSR